VCTVKFLAARHAVLAFILHEGKGDNTSIVTFLILQHPPPHLLPPSHPKSVPAGCA